MNEEQYNDNSTAQHSAVDMTCVTIGDTIGDMRGDTIGDTIGDM